MPTRQSNRIIQPGNKPKGVVPPRGRRKIIKGSANFFATGAPFTTPSFQKPLSRAFLIHGISGRYARMRKKWFVVLLSKKLALLNPSSAGAAKSPNVPVLNDEFVWMA